MKIVSIINNIFKVFFYPVLVLLVLLFGLKTFGISFAFNKSESLPYSVFIIKSSNKAPERNELVSFSFEQKTDSKVFKDGALMVKEVIGLPGDVVSFKSNSFFINDVQVAKVKSETSKGEPLTPNVDRVLLDGEYFVFSSHDDSFDSRYLEFGYPDQSSINGRVILKW